MRHRRKKSEFGYIYVALGLIIGFFIGAGIVYWYSNRQNDSFFSQNVWNYFARLFQDEEKPRVYQITENSRPEPRKSKPSLPDIFVEKRDTFEIDSIGARPNRDTLAVDSFTDLTTPDVLAELPVEIEFADELVDFGNHLPWLKDGIRIAKDSLLGVRAYRLPKQVIEHQQDSSLIQLDSLLGNFFRKTTTESLMVVEFWLSPLNFQGYKMSHNKIILYGLDHLDSFSLLSDGHSFFIRYFEDYYPISLTLNFKPLIPENNSDYPEEIQDTWN